MAVEGVKIITLNNQIAQQIRSYRTTKNMTLADLAEVSGIDDTYIGRLERSEITISLATLEKIIKGLNMTSSEFFSFLLLEDTAPELSQLLRDIEQSSKREELTNLIQSAVKLTE